MRGKHKFKALAGKANATPATKPQAKLSQKDEKIALLTARYVYYQSYGDANGKMVMEDILARLSKEFFVSTNRVADLLTQHSNLINSLRRRSPEVKWFKEQWGYLVW